MAREPVPGTVKTRLRPSLSDDEAASIAERIRSAPGEEVVLVVDSDGVRIVPL